MNFVDVSGNRNTMLLLYELLAERPLEAWISHGGLPTYAEHEEFVMSHPFMYWYILKTEEGNVGSLEATDRNEIGVHILKRFQGKGYGSAALCKFLETHHPLPAIKAVRNGHWLANISPANKAAIDFFSKHGFATIQLTMVKV